MIPRARSAVRRAARPRAGARRARAPRVRRVSRVTDCRVSCADVARGRLAGGRAAPRPLSSPLRSGNRTISGSYGSNSEIIHDSTSDFVVLPCVLHTGVPFPVSITTHYQASTTPTCYSCTTPYMRYGDSAEPQVT